ncbi:malic enzyme-like NAD(P)-binding protein [Candidatus Chlorohelix sp.]|uniref:NAD-dependent malic enzyme n=1 Tax=Candidatus Chlorohelix sp. TaxID=3139201 RepID=UPI00306B96B8
MNITPNASYSFTLRIEIPNRVGMLSQVMAAIANSGGDLGAIDIVQASRDKMVRDITVAAGSEQHADEISSNVAAIEDVNIINVSDRTFLLHLGGKISVNSKIPLKTRDQLSMAYTPGVARVCNAIAEDKSKVYSLTIKGNTVAVISDGTAVLGLGNIGPEAAMPVMEGKAMLFKEFGQVDAFPICLSTQNTEEIIQTVKAIAPTFGGINLEDISAPRCFEIEERLINELDIPVMHDDQHGTAVVVLAALLNALKVVNKNIGEIKVVVNGIGAAGVACSKILMAAGVQHIIGCDRRGAVYKGRVEDMNVAKEWYAEHTNFEGERGVLMDAMKGADVFLGLSGPGTVTVEHLKQMGHDPIVFALANPTPEIQPEDAAPYVAVMATGRSDYPNQINNVLCFPGIFRGALDCRAIKINDQMKLAAARAIQSIISDDELGPDYIIPSVFDRRVGVSVAKAVIDAAYETGVARRDRKAGSGNPVAPLPTSV